MAKKWEFLRSTGVLVHALAAVSHEGPNSLDGEVSGRDEGLAIGTHLQGLHPLRLSVAVNWIAADHVLLGCVSRLELLSSNLITPIACGREIYEFVVVSLEAGRDERQWEEEESEDWSPQHPGLGVLTECARRV